MFNGWSIGQNLYNLIRKELKEGTILELGSGKGTKLLSKDYTVYSIEQNKEFIGKNNHPDNYFYCPVDSWFNVERIKEILSKVKYDLLLVDAPVGTEARKGFADNLHLFPKTKIIIDDTHRPYERLAAERLKGYNVEYIPDGDKSFAYCRPQNVFVLCTGRCGSVTLSKACSYISNYSSGHETRIKNVDRIDFPDGHIEIDNRLIWFFGELGEKYPNALYIHLKRNSEDVSRSIHGRTVHDAFSKLMLRKMSVETSECYVRTVNSNISYFLKDKKHITLELENLDFKKFWDFIGAEGDYQSALREFDTKYNKS